MDTYITGSTIKQLREKKKLTQSELAEKLCVSDKTVSKWETGKGFPDITLLEPIAEVFAVSVPELLSGNTVTNTNVSANMLRSKFYVCPVCGNIVHSMGQGIVICHGLTLPPLEAESADGEHSVKIVKVEDEYFVSLDHPMTREHFIMFIAAVSCDRLQLVRLYPEGAVQARFKINMVERLYYYCRKDGLFTAKLR